MRPRIDEHTKQPSDHARINSNGDELLTTLDPFQKWIQVSIGASFWIESNGRKISRFARRFPSKDFGPLTKSKTRNHTPIMVPFCCTLTEERSYRGIEIIPPKGVHQEENGCLHKVILNFATRHRAESQSAFVGKEESSFRRRVTPLSKLD